MLGDDRAQLVAQPREQSVARRVAVGVVVALEAVEVIQDQLPWLARLAQAAGELQILHQLPAVAQPRQRIGQRQTPRADEHREVLAHCEHQPRAHGEHRGRSEDQGSQRELVVEVAVDEHAQRREQRRGGHRHQPPVLDPPSRGPRPWGPGGDRQQDRRGGPQALDPGARLVCVGRRLVEVGRVGDRAQEHAPRDQQPHAPWTPSGHAERTDRKDQEEQVCDRIGQRDRHRVDVTAGVADQWGQDDRRPKRGGAEAADQAIQPDADAQLPQVRSEQQHQRGIDTQVERDVERVRRREAARGRAGPFDEQGEIEFAQAPAEHPRGHHQPRRALRLDGDRAREHGEPRAEHQDVVDTVVEQAVEVRAAEADGRVQHKHSQPSEQEGEKQGRWCSSSAHGRRMDPCLHRPFALDPGVAPC